MSADIVICPAARLCLSDGEHDGLSAGGHTEGAEAVPPSHNLALDVREDIHPIAARYQIQHHVQRNTIGPGDIVGKSGGYHSNAGLTVLKKTGSAAFGGGVGEGTAGVNFGVVGFDGDGGTDGYRNCWGDLGAPFCLLLNVNDLVQHVRDEVHEADIRSHTMFKGTPLVLVISLVRAAAITVTPALLC